VINRFGVPLAPDITRAFIEGVEENEAGWVVNPGLDGCLGWQLVHRWLVQRWDTMPVQRKRALSRHAPMTQAKEDMIAASEDEVTGWVRRCIEARPPSPLAWPDLVWGEWVHRRLIRAGKNGDEGVGAQHHPPSVDALGRVLRRLGSVQMNGGNPLILHTGERVRLWCVHNKTTYEKMHPGELKSVVEKFNGNTTISGQPLGFDA
jgi:hypothetical protein